MTRPLQPNMQRALDFYADRYALSKIHILDGETCPLFIKRLRQCLCYIGNKQGYSAAEIAFELNLSELDVVLYLQIVKKALTREISRRHKKRDCKTIAQLRDKEKYDMLFSYYNEVLGVALTA